ncbi:MAG: hypothetical protein DRP27_09850 [Thermotogae bacterium]|nr:MAG: hypothetical protein DRP27_09850 [Thermotogota bacterium]
MDDVINYHFLLENLRKEIDDLQAMNVYEVEESYLSKKIKKSKAIAYLVSVVLQVLDKARLEEEIQELRQMVEEMKREKGT